MSLREDLNGIRGGDRLSKIDRNIRRSGGIPTLHFPTGHIGSGKPTELLRLSERLATVGGATTNTVFYLDADAMLDQETARRPSSSDRVEYQLVNLPPYLAGNLKQILRGL